MRNSWLYLAVVMDQFSRRIVGWACSRTADTALSIKALKLAVEFRCLSCCSAQTRGVSTPLTDLPHAWPKAGSCIA
ncbi:DDE-type integrase/transposase/recombinase [Pseudomonas sp. NPDC086251]|uniref:DDE-type integrase/transposase/recombinase n=1 Tax=Pseudomonas sp. NPDC086251 TaxID=3364431 RepID=UPI003836F330